MVYVTPVTSKPTPHSLLHASNAAVPQGVKTLKFLKENMMKKINVLFLNIVIALTVGAFSSGAYAELGSPDKDLTYTPVAPCRILDTREPGALSGILAAGSTRSFNGPGSSTFLSQGGSPNSCNLVKSPLTAALVINFTVVSPSANGFITAFAADATQPLAATLNFKAGQVIGNNATLKIKQDVFSPSIKIYTSSQTHLVADVVGYFNAPQATGLTCYTTASVVGLINSPNSGLYLGSATAPACAAGYTSAGTSCGTSSLYVSLSGLDGLNCYAQNAFPNSTMSAKQRCCTLAGR